MRRVVAYVRCVLAGKRVWWNGGVDRHRVVGKLFSSRTVQGRSLIDRDVCNFSPGVIKLSSVYVYFVRLDIVSRFVL